MSEMDLAAWSLQTWLRGLGKLRLFVKPPTSRKRKAADISRLDDTLRKDLGLADSSIAGPKERREHVYQTMLRKGGPLL